jgi:hypothetical protein
MSMQLTLYRFSDDLAKRLLEEPGLAERVVDQPEAFEIEEEDVAGFNYRDFARIMDGRPALAKALDQDNGTQVGDDFGYGPGWLFTSKEVAQLAPRLVAEVKESEGEIDDEVREELRDYAAFFVLAAKAQKAVLTVCS